MRVRTTAASEVIDESAHPEAALEWWYVHGDYETSKGGKRHFQCSLFRDGAHGGGKAGERRGGKAGTRRGGTAGERADAFCLLVSVLDPEAGTVESLSLVDDAMVARSVELTESLRTTDLDASLLEAFAREVAAFGPPAPIQRAPEPARLGARPLDARWDAFSLRQSEGAFELTFAEPGSDRLCTFTLRPEGARLEFDGIEVVGRDTMRYATYPRLALEGDVAGAPASGRAWLDHQWGNHGWLVTEEQRRRPLGWTWLGATLDDGTDLLALVHEDVRRGTPVAGFAVVREPGRDASLTMEVKVTPRESWQSPETLVRYPVVCDVEIPEVQASLTFAPLVKDQEVPLLGLLRAFWQGAGRVEGTVAGRRVAGDARLELLGHGLALDVDATFARWAGRVDELVEACLPRILDDTHLQGYVGAPQWAHDPAAQTAVLARPLWDLMSRRGKHWRPIFGVLMLQALGTRADPYETLLTVGPELLHTGSLIIDDIEDGAEERRGDTCVHLRYGTDVAINAANTVYFFGYLLLLRQDHLTDRQRLALYEIQTRHMLRSHVGQGQDIYFSRPLDPERLAATSHGDITGKILQAYAYKTAGIVESLAATACVIAEADRATRDACVAFARAFGVAYQIVDDVLDFSDSPRRRRPAGQDLREGKLTYVIHEALHDLPEPGRGQLAAILAADATRCSEIEIGESVALVRRSGVLEKCLADARRMYEARWRGLSARVPPSQAKILLRALCDHLLALPPAAAGTTARD